MNKSAERSITIIELWHLCAARWRWFALSVTFCLIIAVRYLLTAPYLYSRDATIMLREEILGDNVTDKNSKNFTQLGFVSQKSNVTDEVRHLTSLSILYEVANRLEPTFTDNEKFHLALDIQKRLSAYNDGSGSCIINLTYKDFSTAKAASTLELIIQVYNDYWWQDREVVIKRASQFIDSKLKQLEQDLDIVDDSISTYKSRFGITNLEHVSDVYLRQQNESDAEIMRLSSQIAMAEYIRDQLKDSEEQYQLLVTNSGITNSGIEAQINMYNNMVLELMGHMKYTSGQNPVIIHQQEQIANLRSKILENIIDYIQSVDIQLNSLIDYYNEATEKVTSNPSQAKYLATIERERTVKESLYMFLLQKKEENEISLSYKPSPTQILDMPYGSGKPTSPKRLRILLAAILTGMLLPTTFIFIRATLDESVRDRYDIEHNSDIPFLGEVPYSGREHSIESLLMPFGFGRKAKTSGIVVGHDMLNASNEAFRVLRNNLDASMAGKPHGKGGVVYLIKSTQIEVGKTFVGMNLAMVKAIGGQRVLFIDCDLRQASASRLWRTPLIGLSDFLCGEEGDYCKLLWHPEGYPTLDVLPTGALPTNPTELLQGSLIGNLISTVRQQYDSIVIDSPTAGILADADILEPLVDCTLFIIRAGRINRHRLNELSPIEVINGTSKPQYIILNGVSVNARYGNTYVYKYDRSEKDKQTVEISKKTILLNKIIFKKKHHQS